MIFEYEVFFCMGEGKIYRKNNFPEFDSSEIIDRLKWAIMVALNPEGRK